MMKTMTASTTELDDEKLAIEQLKSQLELESNLLKNTIGIAACHYEFVLSGTYQAICAAMPFEVVGTISSSQSIHDESGTLTMTLMVLTSDDVEFDKVLTPSLLSEPGKAISDAYRSACRAEKPALILTFGAFLPQNSGDEYVNVLTEVSGGVPCFGTLAVDDTLDFSNSFVLADCDYHRDKLVMVLVYGNIHPKFFVANISDSKVLEKSALVTKSAGPILMEVNERPIIDYFEDLGLVEASGVQYALTSLPFLLDYNDGTPKVSKIFVMLTPEKYALCAGSMPEGSTLYMASTDTKDILLTSGEAIDSILDSCEGSPALLVYSCVGRSMTLGADQFKEMELLDEKIGARLPYLMATSGGEICPTQISEEKAINRFHNNAFIACLF